MKFLFFFNCSFDFSLISVRGLDKIGKFIFFVYFKALLLINKEWGVFFIIWRVRDIGFVIFVIVVIVFGEEIVNYFIIKLKIKYNLRILRKSIK